MEALWLPRLLYSASYDNKQAELERLLSFAVKEDFYYRDGGYTALFWMINQKVPVQLFIKALETGTDPNFMGPSDQSLLMYASEKGLENYVIQLIRFGANVNMRNNSSASALSLAASGGHIQIVSLLLDAGAGSNWENVHAAIKNAEAHHNDQVLSVLFNPAIYPDRQQYFLTVVEFKGTTEITKCIEEGADVNCCDSNDETAIMKAYKRGKRDHVVLLLQSGADLDVKTSAGEIVFMNSADQGWLQMVAACVDAGIKVNCTHGGETALLKASRAGNAAIVDFLLTAGANPFHCNSKGEDAISVAKSKNLEAHIREFTGIKAPAVEAKEVVREVEKVVYVQAAPQSSRVTVDQSSRLVGGAARPALTSKDVGRAVALGVASQVGGNIAAQFLNF